MPQFNPWNNNRFGFPRKDAPAFQREWKSANVSAVVVAEDLDAHDAVVNTAVAGEKVSTLYVWGMTLCSESGNPQVVRVADEDGKLITILIASNGGPSMLQLSTPIQVPVDKKIIFQRVTNSAASADTWLTLQTVSANLNYEKE